MNKEPILWCRNST